jgi:hypothetical protein
MYAIYTRKSGNLSNNFIYSEADLTDVDVPLESPDSTLFPNLPSGIEVHSGFASDQAQTASTILSAVNQIVNDYGINSITLVNFKPIFCWHDF